MGDCLMLRGAEKACYISFPYVSLSFCTLKQTTDTESWWEKKHMRKERSVACLRDYLIMPTLRHLDDTPEWIYYKNVFIHSFNIGYHRLISFSLFSLVSIAQPSSCLALSNIMKMIRKLLELQYARQLFYMHSLKMDFPLPGPREKYPRNSVMMASV